MLNAKFAVLVQALVLLYIGELSAQPPSSAAERQAAPKNIINIMLDDADYSDLGFNNYAIAQPDALTPNIDNLRAGGRLFPNFYAASAYCSPTRVSVLTGCNPIRFGALLAWPAIPGMRQGNVGNAGLPFDVPQLGTIMQGIGKTTGHFGKWHVGSSRWAYRPHSLGFDEYGEFSPPPPLGFWSGSFNMYSSAWGHYTKEVDNLDEEFTNMVGDFILRHAEDPQGFFVNFWPYTPHAPWAVPKNFDNSLTQFDLSTKRGKLLAMMYSIDLQIGRIVALVDSLGIREQTLIVLTSDNGGHHLVRNSQPYLFGSKGTLFQGGLRVSMIANWSGSIEANSTNTSVITSYDLMPTFFDLCTGSEPSALYPLIDGRSKRQMFFKPGGLLHDPIYSEIQGASVRTTDERAQKVYSLLVNNKRLTKVEAHNPSAEGAYVLNDLQVDPSGRIDVSRSNPALVGDMKQQLHLARLSTSRVSFPNTAISRNRIISFEPRLDICKREATIVVDIDTSKPLVRAANILASEDSFKIEILPNKSVHWTIDGTDSVGAHLLQQLSTKPLSKGSHRLVFTAQGYKYSGSSMHNQIYLDGKIAADSDRLLEADQIFFILEFSVGFNFGRCLTCIEERKVLHVAIMAR